MEAKKPNQFDDLKNMGCVTRSFKVGEHQIKMRSLGYEEQSQLVANVPNDIKESRKFDIIQKEMLAASIVDIDGEVLSSKDKVALLEGAQTAFVNLLFAQYELLLASQTEIMDDIKKNILSQVKTP